MSVFFSCSVEKAAREPIRQVLQSLNSAATSLGLSTSLKSLSELLDGALASGELKPSEDLEKILLLVAVCFNLGPDNSAAQLVSVATDTGESIPLTTAKECDALLVHQLDPEQYRPGVDLLVALGVLPKPIDLSSLANALEDEPVFCF